MSTPEPTRAVSFQAKPRSSRTRVSRSQPDPDVEAPKVPWAEVYAYLEREFKQGDHLTILGPTGTGKTHIALTVAELRSYVIVVACKPRDPLIDDAVKRGYYLVPTNKLEVPYVDGRPYHKRVVYWPRLSESARRKLPNHTLLRAEKELQRPLVGGAIGYVRQNRSWCIVLDEGTWITRDLNLQRDVDSALFQFRTLDASIILLGQRPSWIGRYALSQPTFLILFSTNDEQDRKSLGEISGVDTKLVRDLVGNLDFKAHEFLLIDTRRRQMFRSVAPPR